MSVKDSGLLANIQTVLPQAILIEEGGSERGGVREGRRRTIRDRGARGRGACPDRRGRDDHLPLAVTIALVHSPLTGPFVWEPVAAELARRGIDSTLLEVADHPSASGS